VTVLIYLAAIVLANLSVAAFGPSVTIINAFWLIGLDFTLRDRLHERWQDDGLRWKMAGLIAVGGAISWLLNRDAGQIALASTVAFMASAAVDWGVFAALHGHPRLVRINGSNLAGAAVDSVLFPTLAFGSFLPLIVLGQFAAKVAGGLVWSVILAVPVRRRAA
jgi:queuosine precursor transporter